MPLIKSQQGTLLALSWREPLELDPSLRLLCCTTFYQDGAWCQYLRLLIYKDSYQWVLFCDVSILNCAPDVYGLSRWAQLQYAKSWPYILNSSLCGSAMYQLYELWIRYYVKARLCCVLPIFANPSQFPAPSTTPQPEHYFHYVAYSPTTIIFTSDNCEIRVIYIDLISLQFVPKCSI